MPLAAIRISSPNSRKSSWFLIEYVEGVNYTNVARFSQALIKSDGQAPKVSLDKSAIQGLLGWQSLIEKGNLFSTR